jgi:hypothetical protein
MSADNRLVTLRLAGNWAAKVEKDEITIDNAWDLLIERVGAIVPKFQTCPTCGLTPCPDETFCEACRKADRESRASTHRCAQCTAGGELEPHPDSLGNRVIYLHRECRRFWEARRR